jgi:NADP-dependent 3-hydroxy acid dehydrogenase YdfG
MKLLSQFLNAFNFQSLSPGYVDTEIGIASGFTSADAPAEFTSMPSLKSEDIAHSVMFLLSTGYDVNITELTIQPVGEKY